MNFGYVIYKYGALLENLKSAPNLK